MEQILNRGGDFSLGKGAYEGRGVKASNGH